MKAIWQVITVSAIVHLLLILYSLWHDQNFQFKYTDLDYWVFGDAARAIVGGLSPYARSTYRYTPLLAYLLVPGVLMGVEGAFGKVLFSIVDLICGFLIYRLLRLKGWHSVDAARHSALFWLLNPMALAISTRGNAESLICAATLGFVYLLMIRRRLAAAVLFGFAVHFKIFPIIYAPAILIFLGIYHHNYRPGKKIEAANDGNLAPNVRTSIGSSPIKGDSRVGMKLSVSSLIRSASPNRLTESLSSGGMMLHQRRHQQQQSSSLAAITAAETKKMISGPSGTKVTVYPPSPILISLFSGRITIKLSHVYFALISAGVFFGLAGVSYALHGDLFLREAIWYHLVRKDHRHNFSPYFLPFYLESVLSLPNWLPVMAFIPQVLLLFGIAFKYARKDLPFACFLQTFIFVSFNKVCTSQYFLWYLCFLPVITSSLRRMGALKWAGIAFFWILGQAVWLHYNYRFEHVGENTFIRMWWAALFFLIINTGIASFFMAHHFSSNSLQNH